MNKASPFDWRRRVALIAVVVVMASGILAARHKLVRVVEVYREQGVSGVCRKIVGQPSIPRASVQPSEVGLDPQRLEKLTQDLAAKRTASFIIVRQGYIAQEWYSAGRDHVDLHKVAALPKAVNASLVLALALEEGWVQLDDLVSKYIPGWRDDPVRSQITLRHLASHSSGLEDVDFEFLEPGWKTDYVKNARSRCSYALDRADILHDPGTIYSYSGVGFYVLSYSLMKSMQGQPISDVRTLLTERVMRPLGVYSDDWRGYHGPHEVDEMRFYAIGSGFGYTARALARVGQLVLNEGEWEGRSLVGREYIQTVVSYAQSPQDRGLTPGEPASGLGWWINDERYWPSLPKDAVVGAGVGHQLLLIVPSLELVVVRQGESMMGKNSWGEPFWRELEAHIFEPLMATIQVPSKVAVD